MKTIIYPFKAILIMALMGLGAHEANAGCAKCGCDHAVQVYCRKVCDTKKVEITCWSSECEQVCLAAKPDIGPLAHFLGAGKCGGCGACDGCTEGTGCTAGGCPSGVKCTCGPEASCAKARTRKKLLRRTIEVDVPVVKWVVEPLCEGCAEGSDPCTDGATTHEAEGGMEDYEVPAGPESLPSARHVPGRANEQSYAGSDFAPAEPLATPGKPMLANPAAPRPLPPARLEPAAHRVLSPVWYRVER